MSRLFRTIARALSLALAVAALSSAAAGAAEETRWFFRLDSFLPMNQTTRVRYDAPLLGQGSELELEGAPGLDRNYSQLRASIGGRFGRDRRHQVGVSILDQSRGHTTTLAQGLVIGDIVVPLGVDLTTRTETTDFELSYRYYFVRRESAELGVIVGLHLLSFESALTATVMPIPGIPFSIPVTLVAETEARIPLVGLGGDIELAPRWHLNGSVKVMDGSYDDIEGSYVELQVAVEHYTFDHLGFGVGLFADEIDGRETSADAIVLGDWNQQRDGALVFLRARW